MCLIVDPSIKRPTKPIYAYKLYRRVFTPRGYILTSRLHRWRQRIPRPGWVASDREFHGLTDTEVATGRVHQGIHVYLDRVTAALVQQKADWAGRSLHLVPVRCHPEDWIASGNHSVFRDRREAVFTDVHISDRAWLRAGCRRTW